MKTFQNFYDYQILEESLNTPVEFYLTDDTQVPTRIYGAFDLDDDKYGMSLEQSDHKGIYILSMYRILAKKPRKWSFKKSAHVRPALSTLLKFVEASVPFVKTQMKGIMCPVSGKNAPRYVSFAEKILKRSYITSFKVLPTTKSPDQKKYAWENIFMSRIGVSPASVFSDSKFKKYDFPDGVLTHEVSAEITPKRPEKKSLKTEPSKRYTFQQFEIENLNIDSEIFDLITKVEPDTSTAPKKDMNTISSKYKNLTKGDLSYLRHFWKEAEQKKIANFLDLANSKPTLILTTLVKTYMEANPGATAANVEKHLIDIFSNVSNNHVLKYFAGKNIISLFDLSVQTKLYVDKIKYNIENGIPKKNEQKKILNIINQYEKTSPKKNWKKISKETISGKKSHEVLKTNISPDQLVSTLSGQGTFIYSENFSKMYNGFTYKNLDIETTQTHLEEELQYRKIIDNHKTKEILVKYTGNYYKTINKKLRESFEAFNSNEEDGISEYQEEIKTGDADKLATMFEDMPALPESMWLYRETELPEDIRNGLKAGDDFVDPAFLSTTLNPRLGWASLASKFRIFVPKGSLIVPALSNSKHPGEKEVILPPFSVLKVIRIDLNPDLIEEKSIITCIYVGSVYKDFRNKFLSGKDIKESMRSIYEAPTIKKKKKDQKYNPADKFAVNTDSKTLAAALKFAKNLKKKRK